MGPLSENMTSHVLFLSFKVTWEPEMGARNGLQVPVTQFLNHFFVLSYFYSIHIMMCVY